LGASEFRHGALVLLGQFAAPALAALSPFAGQKVTVATVMGSDDGLGFANDFIEVFRAARWAVDLVFASTIVGHQAMLSRHEPPLLNC
jgi:hypothetical protein